jgi:hypothetical protein
MPIQLIKCILVGTLFLFFLSSHGMSQEEKWSIEIRKEDYACGHNPEPGGRISHIFDLVIINRSSATLTLVHACFHVKDHSGNSYQSIKYSSYSEEGTTYDPPDLFILEPEKPLAIRLCFSLPEGSSPSELVISKDRKRLGSLKLP